MIEKMATLEETYVLMDGPVTIGNNTMMDGIYQVYKDFNAKLNVGGGESTISDCHETTSTIPQGKVLIPKKLLKKVKQK